MKKISLLFAVLILTQMTYSQIANIQIEAISPERLVHENFTTNSVSSGLRVIPNNTFAYFKAMNLGTDTITNAVFELTQKPTGSNAALTAHTSVLSYFKPDVKGEYKLKLTITTANGTDDTTISVYAGSFVGVGNFDGVNATYPNCMVCHSGSPTFTAIFDRWKVTGHAVKFKNGIDGNPSFYNTSCFKCHTTGYDHNIAAANDGFDDRATLLGWSWTPPGSAGQWAAMKTNYPSLTQFGNIGCEMCHGPGSEHVTNSNKQATIEINVTSATCTQCHDEMWRYNKVQQWEITRHSEALWNNSFAQTAASQNNSLGNCIRCHDSKGYINFTKGLTTNTTGWTIGNHTTIGCPTCHDPHGNNNEAYLRDSPASSDTLGNGFNYSSIITGAGKLCVDCHKARRDNVTYVPSGTVNATWGPHYSVQADVFLGKNAAQFDATPYLSNAHQYAVTGACSQCHMKPITDTSNVNRNKVGGHTFRLFNDENNYYHTAACTQCHGPVTNWDQFIAATDYDGNGLVESIPNEIEGLMRHLRMALPPVGVDSISTALIQASGSLNYRKAYWNYRMIYSDGSKGMHNSKFVFNVLLKTLDALGWAIPVELVSFNGKEVDGVVHLTWETATETNNLGFDVERKLDNNEWVTIGHVKGKGTSSEMSAYVFRDDIKALSFEGTITYRLKQIDFDGSTTYSKEINVLIVNGPTEYVLNQNYPNPFNPSTVIGFTLPKQSNVKLHIYDSMGRLVKTLLNETKQRGSYSVEWNGVDQTGKRVASGIYFYKLETPDQIITKKMVLMK